MSRNIILHSTIITISWLLHLCSLERGPTSSVLSLWNPKSQATPGRKQSHITTGFYNSHWANCLDTRRSVGGHAYTLGSGAISWQARKQKTVTTSSCKAEYIAAFKACKEAIWLHTLLNAIGHQLKTPTTILCDRNATIDLLEDPLLHDHVKHLDMKHHFLWKCVQSNEITLSYINTYDNITNIFTKVLDMRKFTRFHEF